MEKKEKALVLFSGGLDSRLVVKILQEKGKPAVYLHKNSQQSKETASKLQEAYSSYKDLNLRKKFKKYKI